MAICGFVASTLKIDLCFKGINNVQRSLFPKGCYSASCLLQVKIFAELSRYRRTFKKRGISVDHATIQRWVFKFTPLIDQNFRKHKSPTASGFGLDEIDVMVNGAICIGPLTMKGKPSIFFKHIAEEKELHIVS